MELGGGGHPGLRRLIERDEPVWSETVRRIAARAGELERTWGGIPETADDADPRPRWRNAMMAGLDGVAFAAFLGPETRQVLEIGSGNSTKFLRHLIGALGLKTRIVSIDPFPRAECDALCDTVIREPLETVDLALFDDLRSGDVVFFDGSHRCFMNSDVTAFFLDVLPRIPSGVAIGVHDIFLPDDYPEEWAERYYSEQYVLAAWLLGAESRYRVTLPAYWVSRNRETFGLDAIADACGCPRERFDGCSFWIEKAG
ncbi:MAG: class I SAM-dependent methyltransferase [Thermoanaerobaculia bacterium]